MAQVRHYPAPPRPGTLTLPLSRLAQIAPHHLPVLAHQLEARSLQGENHLAMLEGLVPVAARLEGREGEVEKHTWGEGRREECQAGKWFIVF